MRPFRSRSPTPTSTTGHFAAHQSPDLLVGDIRRFLKQVR
jgi:hypothetical protein